MRHHKPTRFIAAAILSTAALSHAQPQSSKPPAAPPPAIAPAPVEPSLPLTPAQSPAQRAKVTYTDGQITVAAGNSSLNQILRDIARLTGVKITGGVADERVFGDYGPASPSQVLATLLNGTGSNMLLVQSNGNAPTELILTPRQGGATPPNPNAQSFDESSESSEDAPPNPVARPIRRPDPQPGEASPQAPIGEGNGPSSPNGIKTPQQIYEELQRRRQQQQQQPANPQ
jgi:hypothetical protein